MNLGSESETVEFKKSTGEHKEALQSISAMLNKCGQGELYFGVKDNGDVIGQDITDSTIRQVASWISDKIEPAISPTIEQLEDEGGKTFLRIEFSGAEAPYSADGRYFIRIGSSNSVMRAAELSIMIIERDRTRNPWDSLPSKRHVHDSDERAVRDFFERGSKAERIAGDFTNTTDLLGKMGMLAKEDVLTNAADILFCNAPLGDTRISLARLAGNDKIDILDLRHEGGPLLRMLDEAASYVLAGISRKFIIPTDGTVMRQEIPEIPANAVREAIANALVHRDYNNPAAVEVCIYRDTVQITNPGLFPDGDSPELHIEGKASYHGLRNAAIADAVFRAGVIEKFGTGIPRIRRECDEAGVTFRYEQRQGFTVLTFDRPSSQITYVNETGSPVPPPAGAWGSRQEKTQAKSTFAIVLNNSEQTAVNIASREGKVTWRNLSDSAHIGRDTARSTLRNLAEKGILEWVGKSQNDPHQHYRLATRV